MYCYSSGTLGGTAIAICLLFRSWRSRGLVRTCVLSIYAKYATHYIPSTSYTTAVRRGERGQRRRRCVLILKCLTTQRSVWHVFVFIRFITVRCALALPLRRDIHLLEVYCTLYEFEVVVGSAATAALTLTFLFVLIRDPATAVLQVYMT